MLWVVTFPNKGAIFGKYVEIMGKVGLGWKAACIGKIANKWTGRGEKVCEKAFSEIGTRIWRCIFNTLLMNRAATHYPNVSVMVFNFSGMEHIFLLLLGLAHFIKPTHYLVWTSAISFKSSGFGHKQVQNNKNKILSPPKKSFLFCYFTSQKQIKRKFSGEMTPPSL